MKKKIVKKSLKKGVSKKETPKIVHSLGCEHCDLIFNRD